MKAFVGLALAVILTGCQPAESEEGPRGAVSAAVEVVKVDRGPLELSLAAYGSMEFSAETQTTVSFLRPGQVLRVPVVAGQMVKKGDLLMTVGGVPRGSPEVQQASIAVDFAQRELARVQRLITEKLATNQELQHAEQELAAATAGLGGLGRDSAGGASMRAESSGIVAEVLVQPGSIVQAGQPGVMIAPKDALSVRAGFEVEDLPRLKEGLPVRLSPVFAGSVNVEAPATLAVLERVVDPKTQLVEGLIRIPEPLPWMAAGLAVRVVVVLELHPSALRIPLSALTEHEGKEGVFVIESSHAKFRAITLGLKDAARVEVIGGLKEGELLATTGRSSLEEGMAVRATESVGQ